MKIYFFRHGQTEFNLEDRFQGRSDSKLTQKGIEQAKKIGEIIKHANNAKFIISPMPRIKETLGYAINFEFKKYQIEENPILLECCYGDWESKKREDIDEKILKNRELDRYNFIHPGSFDCVKGESYADVFNRIKPFLESLKEIKSDNDIVIITHQGVMLNILRYFKGYTEREIENIRIKNSDWFEYDINLK